MMTPSTSFDFTSAVLDPRITFARALNTATRVNASGYIEAVNADTPRFDYSPVTLASLGLLVEETRANLLRHTSDFSSAWSGSNASVSTNASTAPTGTLIAAKVVENTANTTHFINQGITTSSVTYTATVYAKAAERTKFQISSNAGSIPGATFDLVAVTATPVGSTSAASIKDVGGGWYRCSATRTVTGAADAFVLRLLDAAGNTSYTGDGVSGMFFYGAQLEVGAFPTSFIPTTTAAVTRNADVATITGTDFSDWWQASKG